MDYSTWMRPRSEYWRATVLASGWKLVTNGRVALLAPPETSIDASHKYRPWKDSPPEELVSCGSFAASVSVARLREFVGPAPVEKASKCRECFGSGKAECPHCEQEMQCDECDGTGTVVESDREESEPGWMFGKLFNRVLIAEFLPDVPATQQVECSVGNSGDTEIIRFAGCGWSLLVAGMHPDPGENSTEHPVFEVESVTT